MTTEQNKSQPGEGLLALVENGWEAHLYKSNGLYECLATPADVSKHKVGRGGTPAAAVNEVLTAIAKARRQQ